MTIFHGVGARLESRQKAAMTTLKALQHLGQLLARGLRIERQDPIDDVIHPPPVGRVEVPRLGARLEVAQHHSGRVGTQIEGLAIQQCGL